MLADQTLFKIQAAQFTVVIYNSRPRQNEQNERYYDDRLILAYIIISTESDVDVCIITITSFYVRQLC